KTTPGAVRVKSKSPIYHGRYRDADGVTRQTALCADKTASKQMLAKLATDSKLGSVGLGDRYAGHRRRSLAEHLEAYRRYLESKGNVAGHVAHSHARIKAILDGCRFTFLADIAPGRIMEWLAERRRDGMSVSTS